MTLEILAFHGDFQNLLRLPRLAVNLLLTLSHILLLLAAGSVRGKLSPESLGKITLPPAHVFPRFPVTTYPRFYTTWHPHSVPFNTFTAHINLFVPTGYYRMLLLAVSGPFPTLVMLPTVVIGHCRLSLAFGPGGLSATLGMSLPRGKLSCCLLICQEDQDQKDLVK